MRSSSEAFWEYVKATALDGSRTVSPNGVPGYDEEEWEAWKAAMQYVRPLLERLVRYQDYIGKTEPFSDIYQDASKVLRSLLE